MSTHAIGDIAPPNAQGETMQPINVTNVQMVNETVYIDLCVENATVKCNFTLMNHGEKENMLVGFPVGLGWGGHDTYPLEDFKAYVNSQPVETREMDVNGSSWMVWDMSFDEMEIKDVDVSYWVPLSYYGNYGRMASHWFTYVLKTGAAWGGVIEEANIAIVLHDIESDQINELTPDGYVFENNIITWNFTSLEPTENIYIRFETLHEEGYTIPGFVSDENHAGIPDATVELHYLHGEIIDDVYGKPLVTRTFNGTGGVVGWYNLTNLSDAGADWIDVVVVARVLDATGNERMGISDPVNFWPFLGWGAGTVNVTIDFSSPPASITNLHPTAGTTWLNWTWTNPPDPDFNHTEIYLNGVFQTITSAEYFNATDLTPATSYTISTRTVDTSGNINQAWMNDTSITLPAPGTTIQLMISLNPGWNLISAPLNLNTWELGEEAAVGDPLNVTPENSLTSIYRYNTTSESFEKCTHYTGWGWEPATGSESFTELEPGRGYWTWAENDCDLTFTGTAPSDLSLPLDADWNCIGWYSTSEVELGNESLVGDPLSVTPENSLTSIYRYNTTSELFEKCTHYAGWGWESATGSESFTELEPGRGYWAMADNDCLWGHEV